MAIFQKKSLFLIFILTACFTPQDAEQLPPIGPDRCDFLTNHIKWEKPIDTLNKISDLFHSKCYSETIDIGSKARDKYKHKTYSLMKESVEFFIPEGTVTDYVLESYERGYLTFLIVISYVKLKQLEAVAPELNRFYNEEVASLYNHGQDHINALLQAVLWDNYPKSGFSSRPFWLWLAQSPDSDQGTRLFAEKRVKEIDQKKPTSTWHITELGNFPTLDWSIDFKDSGTGYFSIKPKSPFVTPCADDHELVIPTTMWFDKIAIRHSHSYHPLVNVKSWIRLPIGLVYGITTATTGAAIIVSGCSVAASQKGNSGAYLCDLSIKGGSALISQTDDIVEHTLKPDLRHWEHLPAAVYVSANEGSPHGRCTNQISEMATRPVL